MVRLGSLLTLLLAAPAIAQQGPLPIEGRLLPDRMVLLGQVVPRNAREITANDWSIGAETMDRDFSTYETWRAYLGPLGAKHARLQSGWQRTDLGNGRYDFGWLDPVIDGMLADGVQPWLSLSYGNDRYNGGGTSRRDSALPSGPGRQAWLAYVSETARRYRGRVREYEIWNEPDHSTIITPEAYGQFAYETARVVKAADPDARIILGALAGGLGRQTDKDFTYRSLVKFVSLGGKGFAHAVSYHTYSTNPDKVYPQLETFIQLVRSIDPGLEIRQGESGAPSLNQPTNALSNIWWTEELQAKWGLRRLLGDAARGVPTSLFTLVELHAPISHETGLALDFEQRKRTMEWATAKNFKGLLETRRYAPGTDQDDRSILRTKTAYVAAQAVFAIFDSALVPTGKPCTVSGSRESVSAFAFQRSDGATAVALWRDGSMPGINSAHEAVDVICEGVKFETAPRYVDLLTRAVYSTQGLVVDGSRMVSVPIYDSPILLISETLVRAR